MGLDELLNVWNERLVYLDIKEVVCWWNECTKNISKRKVCWKNAAKQYLLRKMSKCKLYVCKLFVEISADKMSVNKTSVNKMSIEKMLVEKISVEKKCLYTKYL